MRSLYLVRHGEPFFPDGERYCLGSADFPLSALGRLQACQLGETLKREKLTVFTSPLKRAYDTALALSSTPTVIDDLREMHAGEWDGLSFRVIKERWPELFEARGKNLNLPPPGSENWHDGQRRFVKAVKKALDESEGNIAVVAHTTVILSFICHVMADEKYKNFEWRQDYGSCYILTQDESGTRCEFPWQRSVPELNEEFCEKLLQAAKLPEHIIKHCRAVAAEAMRICTALETAGLQLDSRSLFHAAMLHDIARLEAEHARLGAKWLHSLGHSKTSDIVAQHHELESEDINEAAVLYIADKLILEDRPVSLDERFGRSLEKCKTAEALMAHQRRKRQAQSIAKKINCICNTEVIR